MENENNILIIDDDVDFANFIYDVSVSMNLKCKVTNNSEDFIKSYDQSVTLIFMDLNIPNIDGIELLRHIEGLGTKSDIILMSGVDKRVLESARDFAVSKGLSVVGHFQKPVRLSELEDLLKKSTAPRLPKVEKKLVADPKKIEITKEALIQAIHNNEYVVYYQPKIDIKTKKIVGVEALIRWKHPQHGMIFPDQFIPLAESSGLITDITWNIIRNGVKEIESIKRKIGFSLIVSFNLSPHSLHDLTFPDKLVSILTEASSNAQNTVLEVTETGLLKELSSALDIFTRLRLKNIRLSIDDFGTGYAMMQQLQLIPATELKVDKSFVQSMLKSENSKVTVKKIIEMGHELDMKVVAEGVETKEHLQALGELNCDIAQGYYFSKPLSLDDLVNWINNQFSKIEQ